LPLQRPQKRIDDHSIIRAATLWAHVQAVKALPRQPAAFSFDGLLMFPIGSRPGGAGDQGGRPVSIHRGQLPIIAQRGDARPEMQNCGRDAPGYGLETHYWGYGTRATQGRPLTAKGGTRHQPNQFSGPLRDFEGSNSAIKRPGQPGL